VKPSVTTKVIFTGDWSLPVKEAEAVNSLADQGIDCVTCHVDSPKVVIETAEKRGIFSSGYHANQGALAPKGYLTGAEWNWSSIYTRYIEQIKEGKTLMNGGIPHVVRGGLKENFWKLSPYGVAVSEDTKAKADQVKAEFQAGTKMIYQGELKDNRGAVILPTGKSYVATALELETMNWLVQGVLGDLA